MCLPQTGCSSSKTEDCEILMLRHDFRQQNWASGNPAFYVRFLLPKIHKV